MQPNIQLFNLIQFDKTFFRTINHRNRSPSTLDVLLARGELIEAYFWLALGSEIQFFPKEAAIRLASHRLFEVFDSLDEYLQTYGYLFASDFATRLITIVRHDNYDQILAPLVDQQFLSPRSLLSSFQAALTAETEFIEDDSAELCVSVLLFANNLEFENIIRGQSVQRSDGRVLDREMLWPGALQLLAHMAIFRNWELSLKGDENVLGEDGALLSDRIRQLTRWKLNFLVKTFDARFSELMQALSTKTELIPPQWVPDFLDGVKNLVQSWGHTELRPRVAGASGS